MLKKLFSVALLIAASFSVQAKGIIENCTEYCTEKYDNSKQYLVEKNNKFFDENTKAWEFVKEEKAFVGGLSAAVITTVGLIGLGIKKLFFKNNIEAEDTADAQQDDQDGINMLGDEDDSAEEPVKEEQVVIPAPTPAPTPAPAPVVVPAPAHNIMPNGNWRISGS